MTLLTEIEVATRLKCSPSTIKRLRLAGKLSYLPGRPVLVDEKDLEQYLAEREQEKKKREAKMRAAKEPMNAKKWAQIAVLLRRTK